MMISFIISVYGSDNSNVVVVVLVVVIVVVVVNLKKKSYTNGYRKKITINIIM